MNQRLLLIIVSFLTIFSLAASGWLFYQNLQLQKQISQLQTKSLPSLSPSPIIVASPKVLGKTDCPTKRPEVCTMECIQPPPHICGSDGNSYCSVCQACSNPKVDWYKISNNHCEPETVKCGGWDTSGEIICDCKGTATKSVCPSGAVCDSGDYFCQGTCGPCCYKGVFDNPAYPKCQ